MPRRARLAALLATFVCAAPLGAQEPSPQTALATPASRPSAAAVTVTTLAGGTRLVVLREPDSPVVVTDVFFNVNRLDEGGRTGINALIARMWGGESEWRGKDLTRRDISRIGSAGTDIGDDWVEIWAVSGRAPEQIAEGLQTLITNLVANPRFSPESVLAAKEAQRQAQAVERDGLTNDALAALRERVFVNSSYGLPLLGSDDSLRRIKTEDVAAHYQKYFRPDRAVICVAGNVDPEQIAQKLRAAFGAGDWQSPPAAPPRRLPPPDTIPPRLPDRRLARTAPSLALAAGYLASGTLPRRVVRDGQASEIGGASEYATLLLLDAALAGGKSSRLFSLRDAPDGDQTPLAYDLRSIVQAGQAQSLWAIYVVGDNKPADIRTRLLSALQAVTTDKPFTNDQIGRARAWLKVRHARERQRPRDRATGAGWAEVMGLGASFDTEFDARIDAVTADDVNRLARRLLTSPPAIVYSGLSEPDPPAAPANPVTSPASAVSEPAETAPAVPRP